LSFFEIRFFYVNRLFPYLTPFPSPDQPSFIRDFRLFGHLLIRLKKDRIRAIIFIGQSTEELYTFSKIFFICFSGV